ncbi:TlpA disulfide reductase family protein [Ichthyenterobacterium sp. W332]|uniref:TlpA disulfide reductase family protein n=1 Tax=Microcosmobacter mediterraneus TaxID=3075607 RepID=A0ABU2YH87_9FLAO|nr:TlpA disulfide reductase family protein [Ichthyenterobacterium sp. W332]MDT0557491.1 TlpA disulfide reductase family protein [Ichthyenterobacterium sp. W332]
MKNLSILFILALLVSSCKTESNKPTRDGYLITGNAPGVYNGIRAYLKVADARGRQIPMDTAIVMNEKFVFEGKLEDPNMHFITVDNVIGTKQLILDNGDDVIIDVNKTNIANSELKGSGSTVLFNQFNLDYQDAKKDLVNLNNRIRLAKQKKDDSKVKELTAEMTKKDLDLKEMGYKFIDEHPNSIVSLILLDRQTASRDLNPDRFMQSYNNLDDELKNSFKGKALNQKVTAIVETLKRNEALNIGKPAPTFTAPDTNGNQLALNDAKGKVTIIDFWASWCGPCRRENPNVVKVYNKYHDKGLEIIGVSLDRPGQKERWLKAIQDDKLTWKHVSNLQYFNDPVAKLYNISSIPATYILDENGTIVAKNLRGPALETKIAELLN